ncbi:hypothetical protein XMM354_003339 [Aliiroseovarius sp. xm-m-354]|nr:hypothetical protein [Aliiroseovarius sp. xm-m-354]
MAHLGVHITIETIFPRRGLVPTCRRLFVCQGDTHHGFDRFVAIFPRHHQTQRRAVLVRDVLAIDASGHDRQRVHRLVQPKTFDIGPVEHRKADTGHFLGAVGGLECHIFRAGLHPRHIQQIGQFEPVPRHHHRPRLDTAQTVDALFNGHRLHDVLKSVVAGLVDHACDGHRPRGSRQRSGVFRRVAFVRAELVIVVVFGDVFVVIRGQPLLGHGPLPQTGKANPRYSTAHDLTPVEVLRLVCHVSVCQSIDPAIGHFSAPYYTQ